MSDTVLVFIDKVHFDHTKSANSLLISYRDTSYMLTIKKITSELLCIIIRTKDQHFSVVLDSNPETLNQLGLELKSVLCLDFLMSKLSLALEIDNEGWPTAILFFPLGWKTNVLKSLEFKWQPLEEQLSLIIKQDGKFDYLDKRLDILTKAIEAKSSESISLQKPDINNSTMISNLNQRHEKTVTMINQLEKGMGQAFSDQSATISQLQSSRNDHKQQIEQINLKLQSIINKDLSKSDGFKNLLDAQNKKISLLEERLEDLMVNRSISFDNLPENSDFNDIDFDSNEAFIKKLAVLSETIRRLIDEQKQFKISLEKNASDLTSIKNELSITIDSIRDLKVLIESKHELHQELINDINSDVEEREISWKEQLNAYSRIKPEFNSKLSIQIEEKHVSAMRSCLNLSGLEYVVGCTDGSIHLRDKNTHKLTRSLPNEHTDWIISIIEVGDKLLTGSRDKFIKVWNLGDLPNNSISTMNNEGIVFALVHIRDSIIASGGCENLIKLWDFKSGNCLHSLSNHTNQVWDLLLFDNLGTLLSVSLDKTIRLWSIQKDINSSVQFLCLNTKKEMTASLQLTSTSIAVGTRKGSVDIWNIQKGNLIISLSGHSNWIRQIIRLSPNSICSCSQDETIRIWDIELNTQLVVLKGHVGGVYGIFRLSNNQLVSVSRDSTVRVWAS